MRIGLTSAYDLERFEREQKHPLLAHPQLAVDSNVWRAEHGLMASAKEQAVAHGRVRKPLRPYNCICNVAAGLFREEIWPDRT